MIELLSEARLEVLVAQEMRQAGLLPEMRLDNAGQERLAQAERKMAKQVARAVLGDLDIVRVEEMDLASYRPGEDLLVPIAQLREGAVLVKAKAHKPEDYKIRVDFAADGPSETAWSVLVRDSTGKAVAVATGLGSSDEAIEAAKAWIAKGGDA